MSKLVLILIAIILPPLAVFLKNGLDRHLLVNIALCFVLIVPGILHALWLVTRT